MVQLREYTEGKTTFLSADVEHYSQNQAQPTASLPVFYNPRMSVNRDLSILFFAAYNEVSPTDVICEPLAGSGVRTLRYLNECVGDFHAFLFDTNPTAIEVATRNIIDYGFQNRVTIRKGDAKVLLLTESRDRRFDFVDVDPFGTPAPFLNAALQSLSPKEGLLGVTATDMPVLCGIYPRVALRKYGGYSIKAPFAHEIALRLLIGLIYNVAGMNDQSIEPLVSLSTDHYIRVWLRVEADRTQSNRQTDEIGFIYYCPECLKTWRISLRDETTHEVIRSCGKGCTGRLRRAGPLWLGPLFHSEFLELANRLVETGLFSLQRKALKILERMTNEQTLIDHMYQDIHAICDHHNLTPPRMDDIIAMLREQGHQVSRTHFRSTALRTEAEVDDVVRVIEELNRRG
jgi:tRNA (guanine26-N2/guanine27-N2)-dimethyltransferase